MVSERVRNMLNVSVVSCTLVPFGSYYHLIQVAYMREMSTGRHPRGVTGCGYNHWLFHSLKRANCKCPKHLVREINVTVIAYKNRK